MRTGFIAIAASLLALFAIPGPAVAQTEPRTLTVTPTAAWGHAGTGMILPPRVGGLARQHIRDSTQEELDVVTTYADPATGTIALVYLYRTMAPDVPLWFDRAVATIILPQAGMAYPVITPFARPGATSESGLRAAMTDNVAGMRSTAVAIAPLGSSFLIKIRMGSTQLEPAALEARLTAFIAGLRWPAESGRARAVAPVEACPTPLQLREARIVRIQGADALMDAVISSMEPEEGDRRPPPVYCREPGATVERGVYRRNRSRDGYLIGLGDAGIAVSVGEATDLSALLGRASNGRRFAVALLGHNSTTTYPSFNRLPPLDQALALVRTRAAAYSVSVSSPERR